MPTNMHMHTKTKAPATRCHPQHLALKLVDITIMPMQYAL